MANQSVRITKKLVDKLPIPESGQAFYRDNLLKGFAVRVTANGVKSFIIEKRVKGKVKRITIARYGIKTVEEARNEALVKLGQIADGFDPVKEQQNLAYRQVTLETVFKDYLKARKGLKKRTIYDYQRFIDLALADWKIQPLMDITKNHVVERHAHLGAAHGKYYANATMRLLRALFNFALDRYEDADGKPIFTDNPVMVLTRTRAWFRTKRRDRVIKPSQLAAWFNAVIALKETPLKNDPLEEPPYKGNPLIRDEESLYKGNDLYKGLPICMRIENMTADYLLLLLFTGLRSSEGKELKWSNVDFDEKTLTIPDTKNHETHVLPMSDFLYGLLKGREAAATYSEYVFPGSGLKGHMIEPRNHVKTVIDQSEVQFMLHDLRRTFMTAADRLEISAYGLKRLVNHKMSGDVTAGYIITDVERLRKPMQQITDYFLKTAKQKPSAAVLPFQQATI